MDPVRSASMRTNAAPAHDDFNPFAIDASQRPNETFWPNETHTTQSYRDDPREQLGVPDVPDPEDSDKVRDAKIDAAKNSIARLFQNPAQVGFKSSSYNQAVSARTAQKPNCVAGDTLDFDNTSLKEKLENVNRNLQL